MKWISAIAIVILISASRAAEPVPGRLVLRSGEVFNGGLESMDVGKGVTWRHRFFKEAIRIPAADLKRMKLRPVLPANADQADQMGVILANGDEVHGAWRGLDAEELRLETWHMGLLRIPRMHLRTTVWVNRPQNLAAKWNGQRRRDMISFTIRDTISGKLHGVDKDAADIQTTFGRIRVPLNKISRIDFGEPKVRDPLPRTEFPPVRVLGKVVEVNRKLKTVVMHLTANWQLLKGDTLLLYRDKHPVGVVEITQDQPKPARKWEAAMVRGEFDVHDILVQGHPQEFDLLSKPPKIPKGFVHLTLQPRGRMTVQLQAWNKDGVEVDSPVFGKVRIRREAIKVVEFE